MISVYDCCTSKGLCNSGSFIMNFLVGKLNTVTTNTTKVIPFSRVRYHLCYLGLFTLTKATPEFYFRFWLLVQVNYFCCHSLILVPFLLTLIFIIIFLSFLFILLVSYVFPRLVIKLLFLALVL